MLTSVKIYMTAIKARSKFDKATGFSVKHLLMPEKRSPFSPWGKYKRKQFILIYLKIQLPEVHYFN